MATTPQMLQTQKTRPTGLTILAVLYFIGTACMLLLGVALAVGMGFASVSSDQAGAGAFLAGLGAVGAVFMFVCAGLNALLGWGLWKLKPWARLIVLIFSLIGLGFGALGLFGSLMTMDVSSIVVGTIPLAINGLIVWYMMQPHVKAAFA
jgi:uncharacterized membrane protein (DUF2068 family)